MCRSCLVGLRATSPNCYFRCPALLTNPADCDHCHDWEATHEKHEPVLPPRMYNMIRCVRVDPVPMMEDLLEELEFLTGGYGGLPLPPATRTALNDYMAERLYVVRGQLHHHRDLAVILDPLRGADVDPQDARVTFQPVLEPLPMATSMGYRKPRTEDEPWITTVFRTMTRRWNGDDDMASENSAYGHGDPEADMTFDHNGDVVWDWPVKRIVVHRFGADGQVEYWVAYVRFDHPDDHVWVEPQYFRRPAVYQVYNRKQGIHIEETWLVADEDEAVELEVGEEEMEDTDDDQSGDYIP